MVFLILLRYVNMCKTFVFSVFFKVVLAPIQFFLRSFWICHFSYGIFNQGLEFIDSGSLNWFSVMEMWVWNLEEGSKITKRIACLMILITTHTIWGLELYSKGSLRWDFTKVGYETRISYKRNTFGNDQLPVLSWRCGLYTTTLISKRSNEFL